MQVAAGDRVVRKSGATVGWAARVELERKHSNWRQTQPSLSPARSPRGRRHRWGSNERLRVGIVGFCRKELCAAPIARPGYQESPGHREASLTCFSTCVVRSLARLGTAQPSPASGDPALENLTRFDAAEGFKGGEAAGGDSQEGEDPRSGDSLLAAAVEDERHEAGGHAPHWKQSGASRFLPASATPSTWCCPVVPWS